MNIDEQLYSRQLATFGFNFMNKISKLKILICGLRGIGIEICKNIILSGPEKVTIFDSNKIKIEDLCSNFYLEEKDLGLRRDHICLNKLKELNEYVDCDVLEDNNFEKYIPEYNIVIITEIMNLNDIFKINDICHKNKIGFIYCLVFGLSFYCFVDFGEHIITNVKGKENKKYYIKNIRQGKKTIIDIDNQLEDFSLNNNNYIIFKNIIGIPQLLNGNKRKIKNCKLDSFEIDEDSRKYDKYIQGGIVEEYKEPIIINFKTIKEMISFPDVCERINSSNNEFNLHLAFITIHEYYNNFNKLPENTQDNLYKILNLSKNIYNKYKNKWSKKIQYDEKLLIDIFKNAKCEISPICGYAGGVVSQEIIKYTGIYKPINQWFRAEFLGIIDKDLLHISAVNGSRYDEQILIFGNKTQNNLEKLNIFLIGAGAVGCELLKHFGMMGISTNNNSLLTITDHDRIEKSNLNRQFLFRNNDILKLKSECAINALKKMNHNIKCKFYQEFVSEETENIFDRNFFEKQNVIIMAVDSFESRKYISKQCEKYNIPYFNCGTDGPYANLGAYMPGVIEEPSFPDKSKKVVPSCTLKMFPSSIDHCVLWALNHFEKYFYQNIRNVQLMHNDINKFFEIMNKNTDVRTRYYKIRKIFKLFKISLNKNIDKCIKYSAKKYHKFYIYKIIDLIDFYPPDKIDTKTGLKFWTGNKILPHPLKFDINNKSCFEFIKSFTCLLSKCLNIDVTNININEYILNYNFSKFNLSHKKKKFEDLDVYEQKLLEIKNTINIYLQEHNIKNNCSNYNLIHYEKDSIDINIINFMNYCSNLRAENYNLPKADNIKIKIIAGEIIPTIITSTSAISALVALQLYTICQNKNVNSLLNGIIDLSDNTLALGTPVLKEII